MKKKLQIFVSSTFEDLKEERQAAVQAILRNKHIPAGMELFAAGSDEQMKVIRRWIDESDIYMLILGKRYGSIEQKSGKSYTRLEYEYAVETEKPLFSVIMNSDWLNFKLSNGAKPTEIIEQNAAKEFNEFEALVKGKMCRFASDLKDIQLEVGNSIRELEDSCEFSGWVSGATIGIDKDTIKLLSELNKKQADLENENGMLKKSLSKAKELSEKPRQIINGIEFTDLYKAISTETITINAKTYTLPTLINSRAVELTKSVIPSTSKTAFEVASRLTPYGLAREVASTTVGVRKMALTKDGAQFIALVKVKLKS